MKHFSWKHLLIVFSVLLGLGLPSRAQTVPEGYVEVQDYVEHFDKSNVYSSNSWTSEPEGPFVPPLGWGHIEDKWEPQGSSYSVSYKFISSGKVGGAIGTTSNQRKYWYGGQEYKELYDLIVTPQIKGEMTFYLKPYSTSASVKPCVSFFKVHKQEDGSFTFDAQTDSIVWTTPVEELVSSSTWYPQSLTIGDDYEYIGIRLSSVYIDEVGADMALVPENRKVQWAGTTQVLPGYNQNNVKMDADGYVEFGLRTLITNVGNVPIPEGYHANLMRVISSSSPYTVDPTPIGVTDLPALGIGESDSVKIIARFQLPDDISVNDQGKARFRIDFWEDFTGIDHDGSGVNQAGVGPWIEVSPYTAIMQLKYDNVNSSNVSTTTEISTTSKPINYGSFRGTKSRDFRVINIGAAPMSITSVDKADWIEFPGVTFPIEIQPDSTYILPVQIGGAKGAKTGTVKFNFEGLAVCNVIPVMAEIIGEDEYFADFEAENALDEWYLPAASTSWSVVAYDSSIRSTNNNIWTIEPGVNNKGLQNGRNESVGHPIYSPKLSFEEGDSIVFYAAKRSMSGTNIALQVAYSEDRNEWTEVADIRISKDDPSQQFYYSSSPTNSGTNVFKRFAFPMPAGDYYISLTSGYTLVDNFHGGKLAEVGLDLISESASVGEVTTVNNPLSFTASFKNLTPTALEAESQTVELYANDEMVANATPQTIEPFATVNYEFTYTPHEAGATVLYAKLTSGEESFKSPSVNVTVIPEMLENMTQIGELSQKTDGNYETTQNVPVNLYNYNSKSEFIYTQEDLQDLDGNNIIKISYPYYANVKDIYAPVLKIYMENTTSTEPSKDDSDAYVFTDTESMTCVFTAEKYSFPGGGSNSGLIDMEFVLDEPFNYTGENLRIVVESTVNPLASSSNGGWNYHYFGVDKSEDKADRIALYKANDTYTTYLTAKPSNQNIFPVINIYTEKVVPPVTGTVKTSEGTAIKGAKVKAVSGDVEYSAVSDNAGEWALNIIQSDLDYTLTVTADGYAPYSGNLDKEGVNNVVLQNDGDNDIPEGFIKVEDYLEDFKDASSSSSLTTYPVGWDRYKASGNISYIASTTGHGDSKSVGTSSSAGATAYDFIVSPLVKGEAKFWVTRYSASTYYPPFVEVYKLTKDENGFSYTPDDLIYKVEVEEFHNTTTGDARWAQITLPEEFGEYTYLGFRLSYAYMDDFTATEALVPIKKEIKFGSYSYKDRQNTISANEDGTATIGVNIDVINTGNVALDPETEDNFSVSLARYIRTESGSNVYDEPFVSKKIPHIEPGDTVHMYLEDFYEVPTELTPNASGEIGFSVYALDNYTPGFQNIGYLYVKPYEAIMNMRFEQHDSPAKTTTTGVDDKEIYFGAARGSVSKIFTVSNSGPKQMEITAIEMPEEGFSVKLATTDEEGNVTLSDIELPLTIGASGSEEGNSKDFQIIIGGQPGFKKGNVKFVFDGIALRDNVNVSGEIVGDDVFFADFEDLETAMNDWYAPTGSESWSVGEYTSSPEERLRTTSNNTYWPEYTINDGRLSNSRNSTPGHDLYSPKMAFEAGDSISFYAAKKTNYGNDVKLVVRYSPDRVNWTELATITPTVTGTEANAFPGVGQYSGASGQNILKRFAYAMPEGEYYISLSAGYVLVDNFVGGVLVDVPYDIVSESAKVSGMKMVNYPLTLNASFKNIDTNSVAAEIQTVTLYANDEAVATIDAVELPSGEEVVYELNYTPHAEGDVALYAEVAIGEFTVTSPVVNVNISKESATIDNQIGEQTNSSSTYPLGLNYNNSRSEIIYKASLLQDLVGNKISKISYPYYKTTDNRTSEKLRIWLELTEDETVGTSYRDTTLMTKVLDVEGYVFEKAGSSSEYVLMEFPFDTTFEYDGISNLRVTIESLGTEYASANFAVDKNILVDVCKSQIDNRDSFIGNKGKTEANQNFPVTIFSTELEVPEVTGTVKTSAGEAVEGATVKAESGEVYYETVTDAEGNWSMTIFQPELEYTVTATSEDYGTTEPVALDMENANDLVFELAPDAPVYASYSQEESMDEEGKYDVTITWSLVAPEEEDNDEPAASDYEGQYFSIHLDGEEHGTTEETSYIIEAMEVGTYEVKIHTVSPSGLMSEPFVLQIVVSDTTGISIFDKDGNDVRYFNLNGIEIHADELENGIYIRVQGKKAEKILINK